MADRRGGRDGRRDDHEPRRAVAAQDRARFGVRTAAGARRRSALARSAARRIGWRCSTSPSPARSSSRCCRPAAPISTPTTRSASASGSRTTCARASTRTAAAVDVVLRPAADRAAHQHDHRRHQRGPGFRLDVAPRHPDRQPDHRRHAGGDVRRSTGASRWSRSRSCRCVVLFVYPAARRRSRQATHDVRQRQSELVSIVQEGLGAIRVVKAFAQGSFERERLGRQEPRERPGRTQRAACDRCSVRS